MFFFFPDKTSYVVASKPLERLKGPESEKDPGKQFVVDSYSKEREAFIILWPILQRTSTIFIE